MPSNSLAVWEYPAISQSENVGSYCFGYGLRSYDGARIRTTHYATDR